MLTELTIRNFAIIDDLSVTFDEGLTIMTGETGAGKSIIIDAVQLLTGARASVEYVRHGAKKAEIMGLFYVDESYSRLKQFAQEYDIALQDDMLVLERNITSKGKSICKINGKIVTLSILKIFGTMLASIHSQHDTIHLMDVNNHLYLLDQFGTEKISPVKKAYQKEYEKLKALQNDYNKLAENEQQTAQRIDLLSFQLNELEQAALTEDEDNILQEERDQLQHFEKIYQAVQQSYYVLHGDGKVLEQLTIAKDQLTEVGNLNEDMEAKGTEMTNLFYQLEEMSFDLRDYKDSMYYDEDRLNEIESRLAELNRLKKKYGATVEEMLQYQTKISKELQTLENKDHHLEHLKVQIEEQTALALKKAENMTAIRKETATSLISLMEKELQDLYLPDARFSVDMKVEESLGMDGIDHIEFMLSSNKGEPFKPLSKTASGGELSRIMLAINKIFAAHDEISTVIFDEIDTGVSGRVAQSIAEKMYQISKSTQVLGITHLSQVAAMCDNHLVIQKAERNNRTVTTIKQLDNDDKIHELAKMITGNELTNAALEHAEQLLEMTDTYKEAVSS